MSFSEPKQAKARLDWPFIKGQEAENRLVMKST